jgi:hypothetical protein
MKINSNDFRVREGDEVNLKKWPTIVPPVYKSKKQYQKLLEDHVAQLSAMEQLHYPSDRHAVLVIFQAMNAAGKDGAIRHVSAYAPVLPEMDPFLFASVGEELKGIPLTVLSALAQLGLDPRTEAARCPI